MPVVPAHTDELITVNDGAIYPVSVTRALAVQPDELVTVTEYVTGTESMMADVVSPVLQ